jgi:cyclase
MRNTQLPRFAWTMLVTAAALMGTQVFAQNVSPVIDLTGEWSARVHEDAVYRGAGGFLGDYEGLPINAAARQMAESWDADVLSQPERQTQAHPVVYAMRGEGPNIRISEIRDPATEQLVALRIVGVYGRADRTIWLDGRSHPSEYAEHTWDGFSTGTFHDGELTVTTTHMKMGVLQKIGVYASPYAVLTEHYYRHGTYLSMVSVVDDPIYLEEPFVRSQTWVLDTTQNVGQALPWESVDELGDKQVGWVPHYPLGTKHTEAAEKYNIPFEALQGGAATTYPEYQLKIRNAFGSSPASAQPPDTGRSRLTADEQKYKPQRPDLTLSGVEVLPVQGNVYLIANSKGSNIVAQVDDQGALLVDASVAELSDQVIAEIRKRTKGPIKGIVNTSTDIDHIGGNAKISAVGQPMFQGNMGYGAASQATIFSHEKALNQISAPGGKTSAVPTALWPTDTFFSDKKKIFFNHEPIEFHFAPGHTDGDIIVWFRQSDVIAAGDVFSTTSFPKFDPTRGGTMQGILDGLNHLIDLAVPEFNQQGGTRIIPGHGRIANQSDVVEYRDMATIVRDRVRDARAKGMTLDQIKAAKVTLEYDGIYSTPSYTGEMFVEAIYNDLSRK